MFSPGFDCIIAGCAFPDEYVTRIASEAGYHNGCKTNNNLVTVTCTTAYTPKKSTPKLTMMLPGLNYKQNQFERIETPT